MPSGNAGRPRRRLSSGCVGAVPPALMPAYKQPIGASDCQEWMCTRKATFKVFNSANALVGKYCGTHAAKVVEMLNRGTKGRHDTRGY